LTELNNSASLESWKGDEFASPGHITRIRCEPSPFLYVLFVDKIYKIMV